MIAASTTKLVVVVAEAVLASSPLGLGAAGAGELGCASGGATVVAVLADLSGVASSAGVSSGASHAGGAVVVATGAVLAQCVPARVLGAACGTRMSQC